MIVPGVYDINNIIYHRETFGWNLIGFNSTCVNMERRVNHKNLLLFKSYEDKYNKALGLYYYYHSLSRINIKLSLLLIYIILIIPGLIYFIIKLMRRRQAIRELYKIDQIIREARRINFL